MVVFGQFLFRTVVACVLPTQPNHGKQKTHSYIWSLLIYSTLVAVTIYGLQRLSPSESLHEIHPLITDSARRQLSGTSLFGILAQLDPIKGTLSFLIIVAAVIFVEFLFAGLMIATNDTPFQKLIPCIEKELMVAGCTAFTFKVIINATDGGIEHDWILSLEFADLVVPVFTFVYCGLGMFLILIASYKCNSWGLASRRNLVDLFNDFFDYSATWKYRYFRWFLPSRVTDDLEFRIFQNIFCDTYKIKREAFAFDEYVDKIYQEFCMTMIEIRPYDWLIVCVLFCINLLRKSTSITFGTNDCEKEDDHHDDHSSSSYDNDHRRYLAESTTSSEHHEDYSCKNIGLAQVFAFSGAILVCYSILVYIAAKYYKQKIMQKKGVGTLEQYHRYLHHMEHVHDIKDRNNRKDLEELKAVVDELKNSKEIQRGSCVRYFTLEYWVEVCQTQSKIFLKSSFYEQLTLQRSSKDRNSLSDRENELLERWRLIAEDVEREMAAARAIVETRKAQLQKIASASASPTGKRGALVFTHSNLNNNNHGEQKQTDPHQGMTSALSATNIALGTLDNQQADHSSESAKNDPTRNATGSSSAKKRETSINTASDLPSTQLLLNSLSIIQNQLTSEIPGSRRSSTKPDRPISSQQKGAVTVSIAKKDRGDSMKAYPEDLEQFNENDDEVEEEIIQKLQDIEIHSVFPFENPEIFLEMVQFLILVISLYSALYICNFTAINNTEYTLITLVPIFLSTIIYLSMTSTAALLKAVSEFDNDVVLEVIEDMETAKILAKTVREKIVIRLRELAGNSKDLSEGLTALFKLFKQIDANGNGLLSRDEFAEFLNAVGINFSRKKWNQIFRDIDTSHDDLISFNEFFMFVFLHDHRQPDPEELERVEQLSKEVQQKRMHFESTYLRLRRNTSTRTVMPMTAEALQRQDHHELDRLTNLADDCFLYLDNYLNANKGIPLKLHLRKVLSFLADC